MIGLAGKRKGQEEGWEIRVVVGRRRHVLLKYRGVFVPPILFGEKVLDLPRKKARIRESIRILGGGKQNERSFMLTNYLFIHGEGGGDDSLQRQRFLVVKISVMFLQCHAGGGQEGTEGGGNFF